MSKTFRLFKVLPSFILGMATAFDIGSSINIYNIDATPAEADYNAIASDWAAIGDDLRFALKEHSNG